MMVEPFPEPTRPSSDRGEVLLEYLDYFRSRIVSRLDGLDDRSLRTSGLPSGWAPIEMLKHLVSMERRWVVWGFEGDVVEDPWSDQQGGRWFVAASETVSDLVDLFRAGGDRTRLIVSSHALDEIGAPGPRWDGEPPATLERVLLHVLQEFARHLGHLDIARELIDGATGE